MSRQEMITIAHRGLLLGPSPLLRHNAVGRRAEMEGMVLNCWGAFGPDLNKVVVVGTAPPLSRIVDLATSFFGPESGGFGIVVEADAGHPIEAELRHASWTVFEDEPALVMPELPAPPPFPSGLEIRPVQDDASRRDLVRVLAAAFGAPTSEASMELPLEAFDSLAPTLTCARDPEVALFVGYVEGRPVAAATLFIVETIAGIAGVATVPEFRRRGLGTALTWEAIRTGAIRGCTCATLAAQGASFDLYRKMGFQHVCNHRAYRPPERMNAEG
jgi:ribosomal protein S18 acetylase RimI-like enzyme